MEENKQPVSYDELSAQISDLIGECSETNDRITELHQYLLLKDKQAEEKAEEEKKHKQIKPLKKKKQLRKVPQKQMSRPKHIPNY